MAIGAIGENKYSVNVLLFKLLDTKTNWGNWCCNWGNRCGKIVVIVVGGAGGANEKPNKMLYFNGLLLLFRWCRWCKCFANYYTDC